MTAEAVRLFASFSMAPPITLLSIQRVGEATKESNLARLEPSRLDRAAILISVKALPSRMPRFADAQCASLSATLGWPVLLCTSPKRGIPDGRGLP
jgi:hypothetical protein